VAYGAVLEEGRSRWGVPLILISLGVGAVVSGVQILRSLPPDRVGPPYWLRIVAAIPPLLVGAAAVYAFGPSLQRVTLRDRTLAGVTIALPHGDEVPNPQQAASLVIQGIDGFDVGVAVVWQRGTWNDADVQAIADAGAAQAGAKPERLADSEVVLPEGVTHRSYRAVTSDTTIWLTLFACGPRIFNVFSGGQDALVLHRRILASLRCQPDPSDATASVPAIIDLPTGWKLATSDSQQRTYENDDQRLVVSAMDVISDGSLQSTMEVAARKIGTGAQLGPRHDAPGPDGQRAVWSGFVPAGESTIPFQLATWRCPNQAVSLVVFQIGGLEERSAIDLLGRIRCARAP